MLLQTENSQWIHIAFTDDASYFTQPSISQLTCKSIKNFNIKLNCSKKLNFNDWFDWEIFSMKNYIFRNMIEFAFKIGEKIN